MSVIRRVPKYLEMLIHEEANADTTYRLDKCDQYRIQLGILKVVMTKLFKNWNSGCNVGEDIILISRYIRILVARGVKYRLQSKIFNDYTSHVKYAATQHVIKKLHDIYKLAEDSNVMSE